MTTQTIVFLGENHSKALLEVEPRAAGTYRVKISSRANSLLSSVFVKAMDVGATVKANYFDTTSGDEDTPERFNLNGHALLTATAVGETFRILVPNIHNKPQLELIITGGSAEIGVYATAVGAFPLSGNILDAQPANVLADGGMPTAVYDPVQDKFFLLRGLAGYVGVDTEGPTTGRVLEATAAIAPGAEVAIVSAVVPVGEAWRLRYGEVACRGLGRWRLTLDGVRLCGGLTGPGREHDRSELPLGTGAAAGQTVELLYTYGHGPAAMPIDAFIGVGVMIL